MKQNISQSIPCTPCPVNHNVQIFFSGTLFICGWVEYKQKQTNKQTNKQKEKIYILVWFLMNCENSAFSQQTIKLIKKPKLIYHFKVPYRVIFHAIKCCQCLHLLKLWVHVVSHFPLRCASRLSHVHLEKRQTQINLRASKIILSQDRMSMYFGCICMQV